MRPTRKYWFFFSMALIAACLKLGFGSLYPAKASPPADVDVVYGLYRDGRVRILAPERYVTGRPMIVMPCANVPFHAEAAEGMLIRIEGGIDLYNDWFVCPTDVVALGALVGMPGAEQKAGDGVWTWDEPDGNQSVFGRYLYVWATFLQGLERTVNAHDWDILVRDYIDAGYVREQHDTVLQGDTMQFIFELLFPGLHDPVWTTRNCQGQRFAAYPDHARMLRKIHNFSLIQADQGRVTFRFNWGQDCEIVSWTTIIRSDGFRLVGPLG